MSIFLWVVYWIVIVLFCLPIFSPELFNTRSFHFKIDSIQYEKISKTKCMVTGYSRDVEEVVIPKEISISGKKLIVTKLGNACFKDCKSLTSVQLPETITDLGNACFCGCSSLKDIQLSNKIKKLGENCFEGCSSLTNILLPNTVTELKDYCFSGCKMLETVQMSDNIKKLGSFSFKDCISLTYIQLPDSLTKTELTNAFGKEYPRNKKFIEALGSLFAMLCMADGSLDLKEKEAVLNAALKHFGRINYVVIETAFIGGLNASYTELNNNFEKYIKGIVKNQNSQEIYAIIELMFTVVRADSVILPEEWNLMQRIMQGVGLWKSTIDYLNKKYKNHSHQEKEQSFKQNNKDNQSTHSNQSTSFKPSSSLDIYYRTLGLEPTANQDEIRKAYRKLAKMYHPDAVRDPALKEFMADKFKVVAEAYEKLEHKE